MSKHPFGISCLVLLLTTTACKAGDVEKACEAAGLCTPMALAAEQASVICDASRGSGCSPESLRATVAALLEHLVGIPDSRIDVWILTEDVASTRPIAQVEITAPQRSGVRAAEAEQQRQIEDALYLVTRQAQPYFDAAPPRKSPLLGALGKLSLVTPRLPGGWHVVLVSDGLVFGEQGFDMECAAPKDPEKFRKSVFEARILSPDAFTHASVVFAYLDLGPIDSTRGCKMDIASARAVQEAWTHLLTASGAKAVTFVPRAPSQATLAEAHVPLGHGDPT